jgi:hypothetical protein
MNSMNRAGRLVSRGCAFCLIALLAASGASGQDAVGSSAARIRAAPEGTVAVPVKVSKALPADATHLKVCLYPGGRTRTWEVLTRSCSDRADYCTVFAAAHLREDMAFMIYDVGAPPFAVAEDDACGEANFSPTGVLPRVMPSN